MTPEPSHVAVLGAHAIMPEPPTPAPGAWSAEARLVRRLDESIQTKPGGFDRWPRLDRYSRALVSAAEGARARGAPVGDTESSGLCVASLRSCLETNAEFDRELIEKGPRRCSPNLFPYTLPGSGPAELCMHARLRGPHYVFVGGPTAALTATLAALDTLTDHAAQRMLVAAADVLGPFTADAMLELGGWPSAGFPVPAEGAAALWLGRAEDPSPGPRCHIAVELGPPRQSAARWVRAIETVLDALELRRQDLTQVIDASPQRGAARDAAWTAIAGEDTLPPLWLAARTGDAGAVLGLWAVQSGLEDAGATLILAEDGLGCVAWAMRP